MTYHNVLNALSDPTRRAVLELLRDGPRSVGQLAGELPVSQPAVSQHLRVLRDARLVSVQQNGNRRIYRVSAAGLSVLRDYVESFWGDVLDAFEASTSHKQQGGSDD